jgi:hypothetical protein
MCMRDAYSWAIAVRVRGLIGASDEFVALLLRDGRCEGARARALDGLERSIVGVGTNPSIVKDVVRCKSVVIC